MRSLASVPMGPAERDLSNKKIYQEEEMPEPGAPAASSTASSGGGAEKKYGIVLKEFRPGDQLLAAAVNGNQAEVRPFPPLPGTLGRTSRSCSWG